MQKYLKYGICKFTVVPVRKKPDHRSEQVTQLLFGETYRLLSVSENNEWLQIEVVYDHYTGWIAANQHQKLSNRGKQRWQAGIMAYFTEKHSIIHSSNESLLLSIGSEYLLTKDFFYIDEEKFTREKPPKIEKGGVKAIRKADHYAKCYLGTPYLWGGKSIFGIDCSGFIQQVFKLCGIWLPRDAKDQYLEGSPIVFGEQQAADLAFFRNKEKRIIHVGIIISETEIIHASGQVRIDTLCKEGIYCQATRQLTHEYAGIRRVLH